ncbi:MAG: terpene synthase family protein [Polyangiaceae bacterium]
MAARFVLLFLLVDDADVSELPSLIDDSTELWRIGPHTALLRRWLDELPELATCREPLRARFERSFHDYLQARAKEEGQKGTALTLDAHWEFRRHTIFTEPFLDQWIVSLGLDRDGAAEANLREARQLATDIVLLSNDLGSAARDTQQGEAPDDLNLIDTYARVRGWTREQTIEELIQQEREMVERYRALTSSEGKTDSFVSYVELLTALVDGNLASIYALDFRYRGVHHILDRLSMAEPNALRPASVATRD